MHRSSRFVRKLQQLRSRASYVSIPPRIRFDYATILDKANRDLIMENIEARKGIGDIDKIHRLHDKLKITEPTSIQFAQLTHDLQVEILKLPNSTSPATPRNNKNESVKVIGQKLESEKGRRLQKAEQVGKRSGSLRDIKHTAGHRSYALIGSLSRLQRALMRYAVDFIQKESPAFQIVNAPELVSGDVVSACSGINDQNMVYQLADGRCLSGTGEIGIAALLQHRTFDDAELPMKLMTVTRCFRKEADSHNTELGLYRVHEFDKAEMFVICRPDESDSMLEHLRSLQEKLLESLELHFVVLRMHSGELGASAYAKYDCEAYMHGRCVYGEVTSTSNCTDYQSRRLNMIINGSGDIIYPHTCNGTIVAGTRMIIAIIEQAALTRQFKLPEVLRPYLGKQAEETLKTTIHDPRTIFT